MPEISRFFGIIVGMYYNDHEPAHFHVRYGEFEAKFSILDLKIIDGAIPHRVLQLVLEWAFKHRPELAENWKRCQLRQPLIRIEPLQ